jgi:hypothetical protein
MAGMSAINRQYFFLPGARYLEVEEVAGRIRSCPDARCPDLGSADQAVIAT